MKLTQLILNMIESSLGILVSMYIIISLLIKKRRERIKRIVKEYLDNDKKH